MSDGEAVPSSASSSYFFFDPALKSQPADRPNKGCALEMLGEPSSFLLRALGAELRRGVCADSVHSESPDILEKCDFLKIK